MNRRQHAQKIQQEYEKIYQNKTAKLTETSPELSKNKQKLRLWKKVGLVAGLMGVAFSLNFGSVSASNNDSKRQRVSEETPESDKEVGFEEVWDRVLEALRLGRFYTQQNINEFIEETKPEVVSAGKEISAQASFIAGKLATEAKEVQEVSTEFISQVDLSEILPAVTVTPDPKEFGKNSRSKSNTIKLVTPAITRNLSEIEIQESQKDYLERTLNKAQVTQVLPTTVAKTPLAKVDTVKDIVDPRQKVYSTFSNPFEFLGANQVLKKLNLTTFDLFYPDITKMDKMEYLISYKEVLPVFSAGVMEHYDVVVDEVEKYNLENPDLQLSPNLILALMSIETGGANVESHMAAKGVLQITTPVANKYGYSGNDMFNVRVNIRVGIRYFAEGYKKGLDQGLSKIQAIQYASMYYNGGPGNANFYFGFSDLKDTKIYNDRMSVNSFEDVENYLIKYFGSTSLPGKDSHSYADRMVKKETKQYMESFLRLIVEQAMAKELKDLGLRDSEIRQQLKGSVYLKQVIKYISSNQYKNADYFSDKNIATQILNSLALNTGSDSQIRTLSVNNTIKTLAEILIRF
jgi:hypothetical protein